MKRLDVTRVGGCCRGRDGAILLSAPRAIPGHKRGDVPARELGNIWVYATLVGIWIARLDRRVVAAPVDLRVPRFRVLFGQQPLHRLDWREVRIAVIEIAIGEGETHRLVNRVDVSGRVVTHVLEIAVLQNVERFEHRRSLLPY